MGKMCVDSILHRGLTLGAWGAMWVLILLEGEVGNAVIGTDRLSCEMASLAKTSTCNESGEADYPPRQILHSCCCQRAVGAGNTLPLQLLGLVSCSCLPWRTFLLFFLKVKTENH